MAPFGTQVQCNTVLASFGHFNVSFSAQEMQLKVEQAQSSPSISPSEIQTQLADGDEIPFRHFGVSPAGQLIQAALPHAPVSPLGTQTQPLSPSPPEAHLGVASAGQLIHL